MVLKGKRNPLRNAIRKLFSSKKPLEDINGVYLGQDHFLRVVNQPSNKPEFVSDISGVVTNFQLASRFGNIGLIAHNYLGGRHFSDLKIGDMVYVMNGFQDKRCYQVTSIHCYQALNPRSSRSNFIDLETREMHSVNEVFKKIYTGEHHLVLQTCIEKGNIKEWGRLFVIAVPVERLILPLEENRDYRRN